MAEVETALDPRVVPLADEPLTNQVIQFAPFLELERAHCALILDPRFGSTSFIL